MKTIKVQASGKGLHITLEDTEGIRPPKLFSISKESFTIIPVHYAKSFYNSPAAMKWMKDGHLIILEGKEKLEGKAIEENYIQEPIVPANHKELINILTGSNLTKIKELFKGEYRELSFELASENYEKLSKIVVAEIEDEFGISLTND